jgi:hypothetical protein
MGISLRAALLTVALSFLSVVSCAGRPQIVRATAKGLWTCEWEIGYSRNSVTSTCGPPDKTVSWVDSNDTGQCDLYSLATRTTGTVALCYRREHLDRLWVLDDTRGGEIPPTKAFTPGN